VLELGFGLGLVACNNAYLTLISIISTLNMCKGHCKKKCDPRCQ